MGRWPALIAAMTWPTFMAWLYYVVLSASGEGARANPLVQAAYAGGKLVQFLFPLLCVRQWEGRWPRPGRPSFRGLAYGVGFGLLMGGAALALYYLEVRGSSYLRDAPARMRAKLDEFGLTSPLGYAALAFFLAVVHSLWEEYYWRWFVFGELRRRLAAAPAIGLSSLAFMAHHVVILNAFFPGRFTQAVVPLALSVAAGGAFWAWLYERTGSVYSPWLSHLLIDAAILAVGYDLLFVLPR